LANTNALQGLLQLLQQSLSFPQITSSELPLFRQQMLLGYQRYNSSLNAIFLGTQAGSPGMAFLSGYQNAIRCLDKNCPPNELAAFCVSEKGVKKPWDMLTSIVAADDAYCLSGQKGYVMLMPDELDRLYVIAKDEGQQLKCAFLSSASKGLTVTEALKAPFVEDIPHTGVGFNQVHIPEAQLLKIDGHKEANKPFRYWEDIHVSLSMMAWMLREGLNNGKSLQDFEDLTRLMCQLNEKFEEQPDYYSAESFPLLDECQDVLENHSKKLSQASQKAWKKDRLLLQMGQKIRHLIRAKIAR
jgi:hypothetical protein